VGKAGCDAMFETLPMLNVLIGDKLYLLGVVVTLSSFIAESSVTISSEPSRRGDDWLASLLRGQFPVYDDNIEANIEDG